MRYPKLILGSKSPRRIQLIRELGFEAEICSKEVDELYPEDLDHRDVPAFLAQLKSEAMSDAIRKDEILVTADTVVLCDGRILGKPINEEAAIAMLSMLSGKMHHVITGVCLRNMEKVRVFSVTTKVYFSPLDEEMIRYYVARYKPLDKAGSYGIQEWIGYVGIEKIEGCFYNVMGLPLHQLYQELKHFQRS